MADEQEQVMDAEEPQEPVKQPDPLPEWGEDVSPDKDGGIFKAIVSPAVEDEGPAKGDEVFVHYTGRLLSGEVFDSSVERNEPFKFKLGSGTVIKGWDVGVATMKKGEKCVLTCRPEFAYGEDGSPPKIPGNATLQFEVELLSWRGEDLSKDGGVRKSVVKEGKPNEYSRPADGAQCNVHLRGSCDKRVFEERDITFDYGEGSEVGILRGVEMAIGQMRNGEVAKVVIQPKYGFGVEGNEELGIPAGADIVYDIWLNSFQKAKAAWEYDSIEERKTESEKLKERGTSYFKQSKFSLALKLYERGAELVADSQIYKEEEKEVVKALRIALHLNQAACHLKLNESSMALKECEEALALDKANVKAYFRRGQARQLLQDYEEAIGDFQEVLNLEPDNKAAQKQLATSRKKLKLEREKERKRYAHMFSYPEEEKKEEEPPVEPASTDEPKGEEPKGEEPKREEPKGEEPKGEEPKGEEKAEEPQKEDTPAENKEEKMEEGGD